MIQIVCCFYNEATLIPFFLSHYWFAASICAFVSPSQDETRELLEADPRVVIEDREMAMGVDDDLKAAWVNEALSRPSLADWQFVIDADELIWPPDDPTGETAEAYLSSVPEDDVALSAAMQMVYRVETDRDLDVCDSPVALQRRHGVPFGAKPIVIRANRGLAFVPGGHYLVGRREPSSTHAFHGAHWQNADPSFAVTRRVRDRAERISPTNRLMHHGTHVWGLTAEQVESELAAHRQDARVF